MDLKVYNNLSKSDLIKMWLGYTIHVIGLGPYHYNPVSSNLCKNHKPHFHLVKPSKTVRVFEKIFNIFTVLKMFIFSKFSKEKRREETYKSSTDARQNNRCYKQTEGLPINANHIGPK